MDSDDLARVAYNIVKIIDNFPAIQSHYVRALEGALKAILACEDGWYLQVDQMVALFKYIERAGIFHTKREGDEITFDDITYTYQPDDDMYNRMNELYDVLRFC